MMCASLVLPSRLGSASTARPLTRALVIGKRAAAVCNGVYPSRQKSQSIAYLHTLKDRRKNHSPTLRSTTIPCRAFTSTQPQQKKKSKDTSDAHKKSSIDTNPPDPSDFTIFQDAQNALTKQLKDGLAKLDVGGRFNLETVEDLRVQVGAKDQKESVKLSDLAQVIPRGRTLNIVAGEKEHLKPISSALLGSNLSLNAQQDPHNALQLNVPLPAPTTEARQQASAAATKLQETALNAVRQARQSQRAALQEMKKKKTALADDVARAEKKLENRVSDANDEVRKTVTAVKKKFERDS